MEHKAKAKALKKKTEGKKHLHKVHSSVEYCSKCGEKTSKTERHESGHREYDHAEGKDVRVPRGLIG